MAAIEKAAVLYIRNLPIYVRGELMLKLKPLIAAKAKENQLRTSENRVCQNSDKQAIDTKKELSKLAGVSHDTISRIEKIADKAPVRTFYNLNYPGKRLYRNGPGPASGSI